MTLSRGNIIYQHGRFTGQAGRGRFLHRKPFTCQRSVQI